MNHETEGLSFAVAVTYLDGAWHVRTFADDFEDPATAITAIRALRSPGPAFGLLCVEDDYFVLVRPGPQSTRFVISDAACALDDDFADAILEELDVDAPDVDEEDEDSVWPEGDMDILADLGLSAQVLEFIAEDADAWASEQIMWIAEELGFDTELAEAVPALDDETD